MRSLLTLTLLVAAAACATGGKPRAGGVCPESQEVCLTGRDCTVDRERSCELCLCRPAVPLAPAAPPGTRPETERDPKLPPVR